MTSRYTRGAARLLSRADAEPPPPPSESARARGIATVEKALQARGRQQQRRRWAIRFAAAAVLAGAVVLLALLWSGRRQVTGGEPVEERVAVVAHPDGVGVRMIGPGSEGGPLPDGRSLAAGSRLVTAQGSAVLALSTGTKMAVGQRSDFAVEASGTVQRFRLRAGSVSAEVAKLHEGERFIVGTPDAEVEVRGTKFVVEVLSSERACRDGSRTRVAVTSGVVTVRGRGGVARVVAGETWPADCAPAPIPAVVPEAARSTEAPEPPSSSARPPAPQAVSPVVPAERGSSLAEQNDVFARAMAAARRGDRSAAIAAFDDLLARFPTSPLAESAAIERARLENDGAIAEPTP